MGGMTSYCHPSEPPVTPCPVHLWTAILCWQSIQLGMTVSTDLRNAAVHLYKTHVKSLRRVVAMLGYQFSKSALHKWLRCHPATRCRLPTPKKLTRAVKEFIDESLLANPFTTARALVLAVRQHLSLTLGRSTVSRAIKQLGFTQKRTYARAPDAEKILGARGVFCHAMQNLDPHSFISIDETCLYFHPRPRTGYAKRGQRLHVPLHQRRHDKYTLMLAVSSKGVVGWQLLQGSGTSSTFAAFITSLPCSTDTHVLLDNVSFHKSKVVREAMAAKGLTPAYTPPYSPEYNHVEMAFSVFKAHMRGTTAAPPGKGLDGMCTRVQSCAACLTPEKLSAMFRHVWDLIRTSNPHEIN